MRICRVFLSLLADYRRTTTHFLLLRSDFTKWLTIKLKSATCGRAPEVFESIPASLKFQYIAYVRAFPGNFNSIQPISLRVPQEENKCVFGRHSQELLRSAPLPARKGKKSLSHRHRETTGMHMNLLPATSCCSALQLQPNSSYKNATWKLETGNRLFSTFLSCR